MTAAPIFSFFWLYNKQAIIFLIYFNLSGFIVSRNSQGRDLFGLVFIT